MIEKYVGRLADFSASDFEAVFNCTGFGAKRLCNDNKMVPIRGQVIKGQSSNQQFWLWQRKLLFLFSFNSNPISVHAPWLKTAFYADYDTYILPGFNGITTLGGTRQYESYNMQIDKYDSLSIRERCESLLPNLTRATVVREAVGLRPYRSSVRVEYELINDLHGKSLRIIHNYGHGGYGVTTSPGTAAYAVQLLQVARQTRSKL